MVASDFLIMNPKIMSKTFTICVRNNDGRSETKHALVITKRQSYVQSNDKQNSRQ